MDPISAAISVGGSLLGGLFGNAKAKRERQQAIDDQRLQYVRLREAAELAGFNPLAVLGNASPIMTPQVVPSTDYMGSAIADSAMLLAQNLATSGKAATAAKLNQYQTQNSRLQRQVQNLTLRPDVPGVYARKAASAAAKGGASGTTGASGGASAASGGVSGSGLGGAVGGGTRFNGGDTRLLEPLVGRDISAKPAENIPGLLVVENKLTGGSVTVPGSDGEPWGLDEMVNFAITGLPQIVWNHGAKLTLGGGAESRPSLSRAEALRLKAEREAMAKARRMDRKPRLRFDPNNRDGYYTAPAFGF